MATVPAMRTWAPNDAMTAALLNGQLRDLGALVTKPPRAIVRQGTAQSIPNALFTAITWDVEDEDTDGMHATGANSLVCVTPGVYMVAADVTFAPNATGFRAIRFAVNGTGIGGRASIPSPTATVSADLSVSRAVMLAVGDTLSVVAYQSSGAALNTSVTANDAQSVLSAIWMGQT